MTTIRDIERPLTERGINDAKLISASLLNKSFAPQRIVSSPAVRTYSTALTFAIAFSIKLDQIVLNSSLYNSSITDYFNVISQIDDSLESVMIVGHNEVISETAMRLLKKNARLESLKTCGVVLISAEINSWKEFTTADCKLVLSLNPSMIKEL